MVFGEEIKKYNRSLFPDVTNVKIKNKKEIERAVDAFNSRAKILNAEFVSFKEAIEKEIKDFEAKELAVPEGYGYFFKGTLLWYKKGNPNKLFTLFDIREAKDLIAKEDGYYYDEENSIVLRKTGNKVWWQYQYWTLSPEGWQTDKDCFISDKYKVYPQDLDPKSSLKTIKKGDFYIWNIEDNCWKFTKEILGSKYAMEIIYKTAHELRNNYTTLQENIRIINPGMNILVGVANPKKLIVLGENSIIHTNGIYYGIGIEKIRAPLISNKKQAIIRVEVDTTIKVAITNINELGGYSFVYVFEAENVVYSIKKVVGEVQDGQAIQSFPKIPVIPYEVKVFPSLSGELFTPGNSNVKIESSGSENISCEIVQETEDGVLFKFGTRIDGVRANEKYYVVDNNNFVFVRGKKHEKVAITEFYTGKHAYSCSIEAFCKSQVDFTTDFLHPEHKFAKTLASLPTEDDIFRTTDDRSISLFTQGRKVYIGSMSNISSPIPLRPIEIWSKKVSYAFNTINMLDTPVKYGNVLIDYYDKSVAESIPYEEFADIEDKFYKSDFIVTKTSKFWEAKIIRSKFYNLLIQLVLKNDVLEEIPKPIIEYSFLEQKQKFDDEWFRFCTGGETLIPIGDSGLVGSDYIYERILSIDRRNKKFSMDREWPLEYWEELEKDLKVLKELKEKWNQ